MKGAIGNAVIMNIVITFMILFFALLIGSMAYSKTYKTKNYLINLIDEKETSGEHYIFTNKLKAWDEEANKYLGKVGYPISDKTYGNCPKKEGYYIMLNNKKGRYDYCIYRKDYIYESEGDLIIKQRYNYMVLVYMKFDFPIIGGFIKIPVTGETKAYTIYR